MSNVKYYELIAPINFGGTLKAVGDRVPLTPEQADVYRAKGKIAGGTAKPAAAPAKDEGGSDADFDPDKALGGEDESGEPAAPEAAKPAAKGKAAKAAQ